MEKENINIEAESRIKHVSETKSSALDLSYLGLRQLPTHIFDLKSQIHSLDISGNKLDLSTIKAIANNFSSLLVLKARDCIIGPDGASIIAQRLKGLTILDLYGNVLGGAAVEVLCSGLRDLVKFNVGDNGITGLNLECVSNLYNLRSLDVGESNFNVDAFAPIAKKLKNLVEFRYSCNKRGHVNDLLANIISKELVALKVLDLENGEISDTGVTAIANSLVKLEYLNLKRKSYCYGAGPITSLGAENLALRLKNLKTLILTGHNIGDSGMIAISNNLLQLQKLSIENNGITDKGLIHAATYLNNIEILDIGGSKHKNKLSSYNESYNDFSTEGLFALCKNKGDLKSFDLKFRAAVYNGENGLDSWDLPLYANWEWRFLINFYRALKTEDSQLKEIKLKWINIYTGLFRLIKKDKNPNSYFPESTFNKIVKTYSSRFQPLNKQHEKSLREIPISYYLETLEECTFEQRIEICKAILDIYSVHREFDVDELRGELKSFIYLLDEFNSNGINVHSTEMKEDIKENIAIHIIECDTNTPPPKVFISYSWDNLDHQQWVLELARLLIENGVETLLDQFELKPGKSVQHFAEQSIKVADRIIIIFTPNYKLKADNRNGGVGYEYSIMNMDLYNDLKNSDKIIPILRDGNIEDSIPKFMQQFIHISFIHDDRFKESFNLLLREIYNEPQIKKPRLGTKPNFSSNRS